MAPACWARSTWRAWCGTPSSRTPRSTWRVLEALTATAVRMLDNAIDCSRFPIAAQQEEAQAKRRIGLGVTGLADALIMCRARYGSNTANALIEQWMGGLQRAAYLASAELAAEKGVFPLYDPARYAESPTIRRLDEDVRAAIDESGVRNALLTSVAPTGTISLVAGNVSSGIEPVFSYSYTPQRAHAGRHAPGGNRGRPRLSAVSPPQGRCGATAGLFRRRSVASPSRSPSPSRRRPRPSSTAPSPRPSTARRRWNSTISRTSTCGPTISAARAAPLTDPTR